MIGRKLCSLFVNVATDRKFNHRITGTYEVVAETEKTILVQQEGYKPTRKQKSKIDYIEWSFNPKNGSLYANVLCFEEDVEKTIEKMKVEIALMVQNVLSNMHLMAENLK